MTNNMEKEKKLGLMALLLKENINTGKKQEKESSLGLTTLFM
jgi:hypothetical protein